MPAPTQSPSVERRVRDLLAAAQRHRDANRPLEAAKTYFEVTRLRPDCFEAHGQLGVLLNRLNQPEEAALCLEAALRLNPGYPGLNLLLGGVQKRLGRFEEAATCCRREIAQQPGNADAHYNLGLALHNLGRHAEAIAAYKNALTLRPAYVDALVNLGSVLRQCRRTEEALRAFDEAVRREPLNPEAHWELGATLLALGHFERGWTEYEWRWKQKDFASPTPQFTQPRWDGSELGGHRIFLHTEQGYGDIIQFARYATLVARRGGKVILGCPQPLRSLMETVSGVSEVITRRNDLPPFDVQAPLLSLPAIFGTSLATVPAEVPYLSPPQRDFPVEDADDTGFKIGFVWAGDPAHKNDRNRSASLESFLPLLQRPDVRCYSLQVGNAVEALKHRAVDLKVTGLGSRFRDFGDTAAAIAKMDLVVSVDTSVAHLAGALGKPVWTLLPYEAEWRWLVDREDSPWYPTMRLIRQSEPGNWQQVIERVIEELGRR